MKSFSDLKQQWRGSPPPDLQTAMKLIWQSGILSELQKEYIVDLLSRPEQAQQQAPTDQGLPPAAPGVAGGDEAIPTAPNTKLGL